MADLIFRNDLAQPSSDSPGKPSFREMRGWGHYHVTYERVEDTWLIATPILTRTRLDYVY